MTNAGNLSCSPITLFFAKSWNQIPTVNKENPEIKLNDGAFKVFFNAKECDKLESPAEKAFFNFLKGQSADDEFTKHLEEKLLLAKKNLEWRNQYMTFKEQFEEEFDEAREIGFEQGRAEGIEQGAQNTALENARNFLKMNLLSSEQIAQGCGLSLAQVLALQEELKAQLVAN